jgi:hypothetical protein
LKLYSIDDRMINEHGAVCGMTNCWGEAEVIRENPPQCPETKPWLPRWEVSNLLPELWHVPYLSLVFLWHQLL